MHRSLLPTSLFVLGTLVTTPGLAEEPAAATTEPQATVAADGTVSEHVSYGPTVALVYGIGYAGMVGGFWAIQDERPDILRITGSIVMASGGITTLFGPMLVHLDHGHFGKGLLSAGGQIGALAVGLGTGYAVAEIAGAEETGTALLIGAAGAHISWALFDIFYLAREERVLERTTPAPTYSLTLTPEGFQAGARLAF